MRNSDSRYSDRVLESTVYVFMIYVPAIILFNKSLRRESF
jgi:hypothetical protein